MTFYNREATAVPTSTRPSSTLDKFPTPYWQAPSALLYLGDVRECLRRLPGKSVHCVVTSPPYWGLRDYGVCICATSESAYDSPTSTLAGGGNVGEKEPDPNCPICKGTGRTMSKDGQIGLERLPDCKTYGQAQCGNCFVCSMVGIFREARRVLRDDGIAWLNLGDSYNHGQAGDIGIPEGNLIGVPWSTAFALRADGWLLRQDVIWAKPNGLRESVENRCTKSHEYFFMLTKSMDYYFDKVAIAEEAKTPWNSKKDFGMKMRKGEVLTSEQREMSRTTYSDNTYHSDEERDTSSKTDVWWVSPKGYKGAHFATFNPELITPCILASTSEHGCCAYCGRGYERVVERVGGVKQDGESKFERDRSFRHSRNGVDSTLDSGIAQKRTLGWKSGCGCQTDRVVPAVVLDPFVGSGTTVATSMQLGRVGIGIDLSEVYLRDNAMPRIEEALSSSKPLKGTSVVQNRRGTPLPPTRPKGI